jgi:hypothetical protein
MKETALARARLSAAHPLPSADLSLETVPDPAEDIIPSQPLKEGLVIPELRSAPKAVEMTPELPSKSTREELRDTRRQVDQRLLAESKLDAGDEWTLEDLSSRQHNRQTLLREARRMVDQGAGCEEALKAVLSFLGTKRDLAEETPSHSHPGDDVINEKNGIRWLMPTQGLGSPEHAFETLLALTCPPGSILSRDEVACSNDQPDVRPEPNYFPPTHVVTFPPKTTPDGDQSKSLLVPTHKYGTCYHI